MLWLIKKTKNAISRDQHLLPFIETKNHTQKIFGRAEIINEATNFYKLLYAPPKLAVIEELGSHTNQIQVERRTPTVLEVEVYNAFESIKLGKVAGPDKIENSTLKLVTETLTRFLTELFNQFLKAGFSPGQWQVSEITLLYKNEIVI